jgi:hypothetical protein
MNRYTVFWLALGISVALILAWPFILLIIRDLIP